MIDIVNRRNRFGITPYNTGTSKKISRNLPFCTSFWAVRFCQFFNNYCTNRHKTWQVLPVGTHKAFYSKSRLGLGFRRVLVTVKVRSFWLELKKIAFCNVRNFPRHNLRLVACSYLHSAFSRAHRAGKSTWFRLFYSQALVGRVCKKFTFFQKLRCNTQVTRVCTEGVGSSPKLTSRSQVRVGSRI